MVPVSDVYEFSSKYPQMYEGDCKGMPATASVKNNELNRPLPSHSSGNNHVHIKTAHKCNHQLSPAPNSVAPKC